MDTLNSIITGLFGVALFLAGRWSRQRELRQAERSRFHDERRRLYADLISAQWATWSAVFNLKLVLRDHNVVSQEAVAAFERNEDAQGRLSTIKNQLALIAGPAVFELAKSELAYLASPEAAEELAATQKTDHLGLSTFDPVQEARRLYGFQARLIKTAREEFGLEPE